MSLVTGYAKSMMVVLFNFLRDEEAHKQSFLKLTKPLLLKWVGRTLPGGLYDPLLGPLDEISL